MKSHLSIIHLPSLLLEVKTNPGSFTGVGGFLLHDLLQIPFPSPASVFDRPRSSMVFDERPAGAGRH